MKAEKKYLKTGEAADYIGIHPQTLRNYHAEGLLIPEIILDSGHRLYTREQLDKFVEEKFKVS